MKRYITILFLILGLNNVQAQITPEFKFHLAFEDATGAKDTLWLILDSTASLYTYDTIFGEIPQNLSSPNFHVYFKYSPTDSSQVLATNSNDFLGQPINAQNYVYPITLKWDSALLFTNNLPYNFNEAWLSNDYFFFAQNCFSPDFIGVFCMLHSDSVYMPAYTWGTADQFPLNISIGYNYSIQGHTTSVDEKNLHSTAITIYPNPFNNSFVVGFKPHLTDKKQLIVTDFSGKKVFESFTNKEKITIDLHNYPAGIYFLEVITENEKVVKKIIKN